MLSVDRRKQLGTRRFVLEYHRRNQPVVVTDALNDWAGLRKWNADYLAARLGNEPVSLENDTFNPMRTISFADYLEELATYEELPADAPEFLQDVPYVRRKSWTAAQQARIHGLIEKDWSRPYFLPKSLYLTPFDLLSSHPNRDQYPYFGLYVSPRGAVTGLHIDPLRSSAILCQISGTKCGYLIPPTKAEAWRDETIRSAERRTARKIAILHGRTPDYGGLEAVRFDLWPGEVLYIPMGWAHEVFTTSTSISLTYNFIQLWGLHLAWFHHPDTQHRLRRQLRKRIGLAPPEERPAN